MSVLLMRKKKRIKRFAMSCPYSEAGYLLKIW
jgi:hypothetical protein